MLKGIVQRLIQDYGTIRLGQCFMLSLAAFLVMVWITALAWSYWSSESIRQGNSQWPSLVQCVGS